jgi:DNA-3-methyladenine glycosylase II
MPTKTAQRVWEERIIKIRGIGSWTIDVYLVFCMEKADLPPLGESAVVISIKELLDIHDKKAMEVHGIKWSPYSAFAMDLVGHYYLKKRNRTVLY